MFIVAFNYNGVTFYLKSTIWVEEINRADKFASRSNAELARDKAKKFMRPHMKKLPRIVPHDI